MQKFGSKLLIVIVVIVIFCLANLVLITMKLPRSVGSLIHPDGHYLCVIFPYRNRLNDLQKNIPLINDFIGKQHVRHRLIVVNQTDNFRFNRAALLNIGSLEARKLGCDYIALHDIDIVPSNPKLNYSYPGKGRLMHITSGKYHPIVRYDYKNYIGGVLLITLDDFHKVNGMSNNFWGWGLEDDEFFLRLKEAELADKIERPANLDTNRSNTFLHLHTEKRDYKRNEYKRRRKRGRDRKSGLNNLQFTLKERRRLYIDRTVVTVLTIELFCAPENQSECI